MTDTLPTILSISGHDPSGGAGIQADIEALISQGCRVCTVVTALTSQNSRNVRQIFPQPAEHVLEQCNLLIQDRPIDVIKIGLLGDAETARQLADFIAGLQKIPVILDPVLAAGGGLSVANQELIDTIISHLLTCTTVLTPNSHEARILTNSSNDLDQCGQELVSLGCKNVLITGTHEEGSTVINRLYNETGLVESFQWDRLPHTYHGSGCTLASSIAAMLAHGFEPLTAVMEAQEYTWNALQAGYQPGTGQHLPDRLFWTQDD
ncbi:MAG: hydroxymethylpyrimidine/phosphomethylpyrimidine kinase [Methylococcales bacterium]